MSICVPKCQAAAILTLLFLSFSPVRAQSTLAASPAGPTVAIPPQNLPADPEPGDRKLPLESEPPYNTWIHHAAEKPEEAIVQIRYGSPGASAKTTTTGLVVRCDGFVLVPRTVRDAVRGGGTAEVVVRVADGEKREAPLPVAARLHPAFHPTVPYVLVKINDHHLRSLPMLEAANVKSGAPVTLLWATAETSGKTFISSLKAQIGPAGTVKGTFTISGAGDADTVPVGAIVVDDESGAALGFVQQGGSQPVFCTFARFHVVSSEVGLATDRAAVRLGNRPGMLPRGSAEMVWVPGGATALDGVAGRDSLRDFNTTVACTAGFWMAVQPVTNTEYRRWLGNENRILGLPFGWSPGELQGPEQRRGDRPVCGVAHQDAEAYAADHQSRLPTEVEWRRAAYVRDAAWAEELDQNWDAAVRDLNSLLNQQKSYENQYVAMAQEAAQARSSGNRGRGNGNTNTITNIVVPPAPELVAGQQEIMAFIENFLRGQWMWGQVAPLDWFQQDKSVFGVKNVVSNAPELVQSRTNYALYAPKLYPAGVDPDLTQYGWRGASSESGNRAYRWTEDGAPTSAADLLNSDMLLNRYILGIFLIQNWRGGSAAWGGMAMTASAGANGSYASSASYSGFVRTGIRAGFRCAR